MGVIKIKELKIEQSEKTVFIGIIINLFIFSIKLVATSISGSIALKAETFHSLADFIASLTMFIGLKIAKRKTKAFPYGLYKVENLMSVILSLIILYTGYEIVVEVIKTTSVVTKNSKIGIGILLLSIIITFCFARYEKVVAQRINSPVLLAEAQHIHIDVLSNIVVLISIVFNLIGYSIDKIAALMIVIFIIKTGLQIFRDGISVLLDASVDMETLNKVEKIITNSPKVAEIKTLTGRTSGRFKFIETTIVLSTHNLDKAHFITDKIEECVKREVQNIDQVLIHYEPIHKAEIIYGMPLTKDQKQINIHFGEADWFMFIKCKIGDKVASKVDFIKNPYVKQDKAKGILVAEFLVENGVDFIIVKSGFASKGPAYVFSNFNAEVLMTDKENPLQAIEELGLTYTLLES